MEKERNHSIDALRLLCAFFVVTLHYHPSSWNFITPITYCAVPIFFMISGYLLSFSDDINKTVHRENLPIKIFILNNRVLGKISETQHFNHADRFAATAVSGGYTVPKFTKIAEAYGIRSVPLDSYEQLDEYAEWFMDDKPCLFDIALLEASFLTPKIKFETGVINPKLDDASFAQAKAILKKD